MKRILIFLLTLSFISCEKDKLEPEKDIYASITMDGATLNYNDKDSVYFDGFSFSYIIGGPFSSYTFEGGFKNQKYTLDNFRNTIYDQFTISFRNIPFDSIKIGSYNFTGIKKMKMYNDVGMEINWMNTTMWELLMSKYLSSEEYLTFIKYNPNSNYLDMFDEWYFMNSSNIINEGTIDVTNTYYKDYERYSIKDSTYKTMRDMIVEGKINKCYIRSRIDTSIIKMLKGDFRIHIPYPQQIGR